MTIRGKVYSYKRKRYHYNYLSSGKCSIYPFSERPNQWQCLDDMDLNWDGRYPNGNCFTYDSIPQATYGRECSIPSYQ